MKLHSDISTFWRRASRVTRWILIIIIVLIAIRIALPFAVKDYVNHTLDKSRDYTGSIGDVSMKLWHGGYRIHQIKILKRDGKVSTPLFSAREVDIEIEWRPIFHGSLVGQITARQPRINFVSGPTPQQSQNGKDENWNKILESLFPFNLNRVEISDGEIHFKNPASDPPVDIFASGISATATNLTNARDVKEKLPSGVRATGTIFGSGKLDLQLQMNLLKPSPAFEINCGMTNVDLTKLNDFLRAYGKFDVEHGQFALYTSVASDNGAYTGYFKVFFADLNVFEWKKDRQKNVLEVFWQAIVGTVATVFKNQPKDQLAAKVPISGTYENNSSVGIVTAVATLLQNAFIHALVPKLDQPVSVEQVDKKSP